MKSTEKEELPSLVNFSEEIHIHDQGPPDY
jgi:hypothetical protein